MAPPKKTAAQYESEAIRQGDCLLHKTAGTARHVYQLRHGPLPVGLCVLHRCDNPACIADAHHWPGTKKDNTQDAVAKGRHSGFRKGGVRFSGGHTEEARAKIGEASRQRWADPEYKARLSAAAIAVNAARKDSK